MIHADSSSPEVGPKSKALCPEMQTVCGTVMGTHTLWDLLGVVSVGLDEWCGAGVGIGEAKSTEV